MIMTARPHPPGHVEVMRNNESHWSGLIGTAKSTAPCVHSLYIIINNFCGLKAVIFNCTMPSLSLSLVSLPSLPLRLSPLHLTLAFHPPLGTR